MNALEALLDGGQIQNQGEINGEPLNGALHQGDINGELLNQGDINGAGDVGDDENDYNTEDESDHDADTEDESDYESDYDAESDDKSDSEVTDQDKDSSSDSDTDSDSSSDYGGEFPNLFHNWRLIGEVTCLLCGDKVKYTKFVEMLKHYKIVHKELNRLRKRLGCKRCGQTLTSPAFKDAHKCRVPRKYKEIDKKKKKKKNRGKKKKKKNRGKKKKKKN